MGVNSTPSVRFPLKQGEPKKGVYPLRKVPPKAGGTKRELLTPSFRFSLLQGEPWEIDPRFPLKQGEPYYEWIN